MITVTAHKVRKSKIVNLLAFLALSNLLLAGCASTTQIKSVPSGAMLYVDNVKQCETPCAYSDTAIAGSAKPIKLKKAGYKDFESVIRKSEFQVGPCIGGIFAAVPFLWVLGYPEHYEFEMEKGGTARR